MPISDWFPLMPDSIIHRAAVERNPYGKVTGFGAPVTYRARVSYKNNRRISRLTGEDVTTGSVAWVGGLIPNLHVDDEITLPDGTKPLLVDWDIIPDKDGPLFCKLFFR